MRFSRWNNTGKIIRSDEESFFDGVTYNKPEYGFFFRRGVGGGRRLIDMAACGLVHPYKTESIDLK